VLYVIVPALALTAIAKTTPAINAAWTRRLIVIVCFLL
jgi:hypothetical protein